MIEVKVRKRGGPTLLVDFTTKYLPSNEAIEWAKRRIVEKGIQLEPGDLVIVKIGYYVEAYEVTPGGTWKLLVATGVGL